MKDLNAWFQKDVLTGATEIDDADIRKARKRWNKNRARRPLETSERTLYDAMKNNPDAFLDRNIFVWIYEHEGLADWAESAKSAAQDERKNSSIDCWQDVGKTLPEGSIVIDFDLQEKKIIIDDVYAVLTDNPFIKTKNGDILLCQPVKNVLDLPLGSKIRWKQAAMRAVKAEPHRNEWHVEQFHQYLWAEA